MPDLALFDFDGTLTTRETFPAFMRYAVVRPRLLAGGIWTALTTTATGLAIALIAYFVSSWLDGRIDDERQSIELAVSAAIHGRIARPQRG